MSKKQLGQFFTKEADYIFGGLDKYIKNKKVADPFAGAGDLLNWANKNGANKIIGYDIDLTHADSKKIILNDSLLAPKKYFFVITNPPYLNINKANKSTKKRYFDHFQYEDLYQISLASIMDSDEGIVIVPVNFLSAENSKKIRDVFFAKFRIVEMNYFKQQVFVDTTYNVIAFYYKKKKNIFDNSFVIKCKIFPDGQRANIKLEQKFHWTIGGNDLIRIEKQKNILGVHRLVENDLKFGSHIIKAAHNHIKTVKEYRVSSSLHDSIKENLILLRAIDSGTSEGKIRLENIKKYGIDCLVSKESSRNMIYLLFKESLSLEDQEKIITTFNEEINKLREDYFSLFMTNFRDNDRKRISFEFVYKFINYLYFSKINSKTERQISLLPMKQYEQVG